jgi:hypothetical protein
LPHWLNTVVGLLPAKALAEILESSYTSSDSSGNPDLLAGI